MPPAAGPLPAHQAAIVAMTALRASIALDPNRWRTQVAHLLPTIGIPKYWARVTPQPTQPYNLKQLR